MLQNLTSSLFIFLLLCTPTNFMKLIAAFGENLELGKDNRLLWHLSSDLRRFKALTIRQTVVMGSRTFQSIIDQLGKPLPHRKHLVLTRSSIATSHYSEVTYINNVSQITEYAVAENTWVIGGGEIYKLLFPLVNELYLTCVHESFPQADTWFPAWNHDDFNCVKEEPNYEENYTYFEYIRIRN